MKKVNRKKLYIGLAALSVLIIAGAYFGKAAYDKQTGGTFFPKAGPSSSVIPPSNPQSAGSSASTTKNLAATSPVPVPVSSTAATSPAKQVTITSPYQGASVTSGTAVSGTTTANEVHFILKGSKSGQLTSGTVQASNGSFSFNLAFENQVVGGNDTGVLEIYTATPEGVQIDNATIAVNING